jgi:hypothetical protein
MKILLIGFILLVAWNAGLGLLAATCIAGLLLTQIGAQNIRDGKIRGKDKIVIGVGLGGVTLAASFLKLAFVFLAWTSLATAFPGFEPWVKSVWALIVAHESNGD